MKKKIVPVHLFAAITNQRVSTNDSVTSLNLRVIRSLIKLQKINSEQNWICFIYLNQLIHFQFSFIFHIS